MILAMLRKRAEGVLSFCLFVLADVGYRQTALFGGLSHQDKDNER
jgi:hypothetical protein